MIIITKMLQFITIKVLTIAREYGIIALMNRVIHTRRNDGKTRRTVLTFIEKARRMLLIKSKTNVKTQEVHMTKAVNYTSEMVSEMAAQTPLNLEKAQALSIQLNRSVRSIIAKAKREGIDYVSVKPAAKRVKGQTKAEMVKAIAEKLNADSLDGLEKAPAITLGRLLECL
jgi:hypothetical protein